MAEFIHTGLKNHVAEAAIMLADFGNEGTRCFGSGVIIGGGIALTARHVIEAVVEARTGERPKSLRGATPMNLQAIHFVENGARMQAWNVRRTYCGPTRATTDLAILQLEPTSEAQLSYLWGRP